MRRIPSSWQLSPRLALHVNRIAPLRADNIVVDANRLLPCCLRKQHFNFPTNESSKEGRDSWLPGNVVPANYVPINRTAGEGGDVLGRWRVCTGLEGKIVWRLRRFNRARLKLLPVDVSTSGVSGVLEVRVVIGYNGVAVCLVAVEIRRARSRHLRH